MRLGVGFNMLVITGPNTGGKTVTLKTTGLLVADGPVRDAHPGRAKGAPCRSSHVLADIGDEQSLEQSLSTFSSHISRIATIFATADDKSLVLLDELGAGHRSDRRGGARAGDPRPARPASAAGRWSPRTSAT